ncbi:MAG: hypothetical protein OXP68_05165 [Anaerolineaceae bacterium]|nr:hypothetical protein [Anaerolineaceae bacterium]MDE0327674.1 hypothetical protein [Anaerolineaceae bacterium]
MSDDNRNSEIKAQEYFDEAYQEAQKRFGKRAAGLGWLRHIRADIGRRQGNYWKFMQDNMPEWHREPVPEQSEGLALEPGKTVRTVVPEAATKGLILAVDLMFLELREYGMGIIGSFDGAIDQGAEAFSKLIGTVRHTGFDDEDRDYAIHLEMSEEEQQREEESLPINVWMRWGYGAPDEEAARRHGYYVQYSHKGFRYVKRPDDGSVPSTWVDVED